MKDFIDQYYVFIIYFLLILLAFKIFKRVVAVLLVVVVGGIVAFYSYDVFLKPTVEEVFATYQQTVNLDQEIIDTAKDTIAFIKDNAEKVKIRKDGVEFIDEGLSGNVGLDNGIFLEVKTNVNNADSIKSLVSLVNKFDSSLNINEEVVKAINSGANGVVKVPKGFIEIAGEDLRVYINTNK